MEDDIVDDATAEEDVALLLVWEDDCTEDEALLDEDALLEVDCRDEVDRMDDDLDVHFPKEAWHPVPQ